MELQCRWQERINEMEKAKLRIEKRGTAKYGYILLAILTVATPGRYLYFEDKLIMIADQSLQLEIRLEPWKRRFDIEFEVKQRSGGFFLTNPKQIK